MADLVSGILFDIALKTAELTKGVNDAKSQLGGLNKAFGEVKTAISGAFTIGAIVAGAKAIFDFASDIDDLIGKFDDLGQSIDLSLNAAKAKAIANVFDQDVNGVIEAAVAVSKQFGISVNEALGFVQQGLSLAGPQSEKYLKSLRDQAAGYATLGGSADQFFSVVTSGYRDQSNFEKILADGQTVNVQKFSELTAQMNGGQKLQQDLIDSATELNTVWTTLFDGTGDLTDSLNAKFNHLLAVTIKGMIYGVIDLANYFIELYNKAILFRGLIEIIALNFKGLYDTAKVFFLEFFNFIASAAKLLKAAFTGNFSAIPDILKEGITKSATVVKDGAKDLYEDFKTAFENTAHNDPISLIAKPSFDQAATNGHGDHAAINIPQPTGPATTAKPAALPGIKGVAIGGLDFSKLPAMLDATSKALKNVTTNVGYTYSAFEKLGMSIKENIQDNAIGIIQSLGQTIASNVSQGISSLKDFGNAFLQTAKQVISAALSQALAEAILSASDLPFPANLIAAGVAVGAVSALFAAIPSFADGGTVGSGSSLIRMNEQGGELAVLPNGSTIIPHDLSTKIASNQGSNVNVSGAFTISGDSLRLVLAENNRRRNLAN